MAIHFRLDINELRPLGRTARGVKSMNLRKEDNLVSMDVLTSDLVDQLATSEDLKEESDENLEVNSSEGPWVLIASAFGLGKRVPVAQFRLQKRAGMGLRAIKFRIRDDVLVCLKVLGEGEELLFVTEKGVIVRTNADKISQQSRAATGVKLQRLDEGDHLSEVVLVPREQIEGKNEPSSGEED
jgi:DNA gyrase subunit A